MGSLPIALTAANFLGCLLITYVHPRLGSGKMYGIGASFAAVGFLIALVSRQSTVFLAGYFVLYLGQALIDFCFPLGIYDMVEAEKVGQFSAARSLLYTVAVAVFVYFRRLSIGYCERFFPVLYWHQRRAVERWTLFVVLPQMWRRKE